MATENLKHEQEAMETLEVETDLSQDARDMIRMGKVQETRRMFGLFPLLGFTAIMLASWEAVFPLATQGLLNGGGPSLVYGYIFAFLGSLALCASISEMASMYPTSGGQYHWIALLAPPRYSKFLSWIAGWLSVLGWQSGSAGGLFLSGTIIQGLVVLNYPEYETQRWHGTLIMYAILLLCLFINTVAVRVLPAIEGMILILHIVGFFAILIPLVHLAPMNSAKEVFTQFFTISEYSPGLSFFVALTSSSTPFIGFDGAAHMAEEVKDAAINVPRSMFFTIFINGALGFAMYIAFLFGAGNIIHFAETPTGWPFIPILVRAVGSNGGATAITSILIALYIAASVGYLASASRQLWAFARDRGVPFSAAVSKVHPVLKIPVLSVAVTVTFSVLVGLINIGSTAAFNAIISCLIVSLFSTYIISISLMIRKRILKEDYHVGPWHMGRWGLPVNIFAIIYALIAMVFSFFPVVAGDLLTLVNMNWSSVMFTGIVVFGLIYYAVFGRKQYDGPVIDPRFKRGTAWAKVVTD